MDAAALAGLEKFARRDPLCGPRFGCLLDSELRALLDAGYLESDGPGRLTLTDAGREAVARLKDATGPTTFPLMG